MIDPNERERIESTTVNSQVNRERKQLISLGGTALTESGKLTRTNFFRFIGHDLDEYDDIELTKEQAVKIHNHLQKLSTGSTAMVPLYCSGPKCPFRSRCPLYKIKKHQLAKQCPIESQLLKEFIIRYFEEYDVDPNNFTEIAYISELAEIEIYLMRLNMNLSKPENAELIIDQAVGVDREGTPILQKNLSPFMEQKEKLQNRRSKIIKLMVGDRQEKYKKEAALKVKEDSDPSSKMASMKAKLDKLNREIKNVTPNILTPENIIDADD